MQEPKTIEQLRQWCTANNLPLAAMHVYIGEDYRGGVGFGIYQDPRTGEFVTYKNKSDGTRAERYRGLDEAFAVRELWLKTRERVQQQKQVRGLGKPSGYEPESYIREYDQRHGGRNYGGGRESGGRSRRGGKRFTAYSMISVGITFAIVILVLALAFVSIMKPSRGYYAKGYGDDRVVYYCQGWDWYLYDSYYDTWRPVDGVDGSVSDYNHTVYGTYGVDTDFEDSGYYVEPDDDDDGWDYGDSDDSWDSDWDWGGGFDDWDSDW